jgi:hypothetical protein
MYRPTSPQRPLFGVESRAGAVKRTRLERTWAHQYRRCALPLIDEGRFARYFDPDNGRPNKSVRLVVSVLVLKDVFDYTDGEALEALEWNTLWHYALDVLPEEAHTCQKTLHNFRKLLLDGDQGADLFESVTRSIIEAAGLRTERQRLDSTHVVSNIRLLTRLGLFVQTITRFLEDLRREHPRLAARITDELCARYLDREGYFADARSSEAERRLGESALDLYWIVESFKDHHDVRRMASFQLVERLWNDQCELPATTTPACIVLRKDVPSSSLQSPADPDATYGHKGKGYEAQLCETCVPENPFQAVTAVSVNGANESDQDHVVDTIEQVERTCGEAPATLQTDAGYASGDNLVAAEEMGTNLAAPIGSKASEKHLPVAQFEFDEKGERALRCPAGHSPDQQQAAATGTRAYFEMCKCRECPLAGECPTRELKGRRVLAFDRADVAVARRREEQETPAFKEQHRLRSGGEAMNSELKRCHGMRKLRVRGRPRVELAVRLKATALNVKRYVRHLVEKAVETAAKLGLPEPVCAC